MGKLGQLARLRDIFVTPLPPAEPLPTYPAVMHARESRMTPQERQLVDELFDRLAGLENNPRDPDAERVVADGVRRAPHAIYALVQTALVMDEALQRANARIEELQAQVGSEEQQQQPGGFLDSMRDAVLGRRDPRGSVPSVRAQPQFSSAPPPYQSQGRYPPQMPPPYPGAAFGSGGSFLGTAASTAAGVIGGGLLLNSIRSMFGDHTGLAHAAGIDAIGRGGVAEKQRDRDQDQDQDDQDQADQDRDQDQDQDQDDEGGDFGGDDSDFA
jgi:uncharacterized protein